MTRHRSELLAHAASVPLLVDAIEAAGKAALAAPSGTRHADEHSADSVTLPVRTVHAALGHELGQSAEGLRAELHKWRPPRALGDETAARARVPGAKKVVRLVDAAARLGWIQADAQGSGAESLVAWCRDEVRRLEDVASNLIARRANRARGEAVDAIDQAVSLAMDKAFESQAAPLAVSLLLTAVESVDRYFAGEHQPEKAADVFEDVAERLHHLARKLAQRAKEMHTEDAAMRQAVIEQLDESMRAELLFARTETPTAQLKLRQTALRLGIGSERLARILMHLRSGEGLTEDELKRREELLLEYEGVRAPSEWYRRSDSDSSRNATGPRWADVKRQLAARSKTKK